MRTLRLIIAVITTMALVLSMVGCSNTDDVAAIVNGEEIPKSDLEDQMDKLEEQYPQMFEGPDAEAKKLDFQQRLLDNMINSVLIRQAAEDMDIEISDADVDAQIEELKTGFQSEEQFEEALDQAGMDLETLEDQVHDQLLTEALLDELTSDTEVTDADIEEYYEANTEQFEQDAAVHVAHILFSPEDEDTAKVVLTQIQEDGDFAALATEYSIDEASAQNGGDLGWPTTPYVPEFQAAAEELEPGEVSGLVESTFGFHIIKMVEKREASQMSLEEATPQIEQILIQEANANVYQEFLNELRDEADIEILIPGLEPPEDDSETSE